MADHDMLLAEEVLLLVTDDEKGHTTASHANTLVAGALLADLADAGCLVEADKNLTVAPDANITGPPILARALDVTRDHADPAKPVKADKLLKKLRDELKPISDQAAQRLVEGGVLTLKQSTFLGIKFGNKAPTVDPMPEQQLRARLGDILVRGVTPSDHDAELVAILKAADLIRKVVDKDDRKTAKERAKQIESDGPGSPAVKAVVDEINSAMMVAIVAASAGAAAGGS